MEGEEGGMEGGRERREGRDGGRETREGKVKGLFQASHDGVYLRVG